MTQELSLITEDGVRLRATRQGRGASLVLCHGGPGLWDYLPPFAATVEDLVEVWRYDQRGCGRSDGAGGPYTLERFVADLERVRATTGQERWIVGGHSWGATLALLYATAYPGHVLGLLYVCGTGIEWPRWKAEHDSERERRLATSARYAELSKLKTRTAEEGRELLALRWATDYVDFSRGLELARLMLSDNLQVNHECNAALNAEIDAMDLGHWRELCARLRAPVLLLQGEADPRPVAALDSLAGALPHATRLVLPGCAHYLWLETPDTFRRVVRGWLRDVTATTGTT